MKTFEEALGMVACKCGFEDAEQRNEQLLETHARYEGLVSEALMNETLQKIMEAWTITLPVKSLIFTAFVSGMIAGIEMEKAE